MIVIRAREAMHSCCGCYVRGVEAIKPALRQRVYIARVGGKMPGIRNQLLWILHHLRRKDTVVEPEVNHQHVAVKVFV